MKRFNLTAEQCEFLDEQPSTTRVVGAIHGMPIIETRDEERFAVTPKMRVPYGSNFARFRARYGYREGAFLPPLRVTPYESTPTYADPATLAERNRRGVYGA